MVTPTCPTCGTPTRLSTSTGHVELCTRCTNRELGETAEMIRDRATARAAKGRRRKWQVGTGPRERGVRR